MLCTLHYLCIDLSGGESGRRRKRGVMRGRLGNRGRVKGIMRGEMEAIMGGKSGGV